MAFPVINCNLFIRLKRRDQEQKSWELNSGLQDGKLQWEITTIDAYRHLGIELAIFRRTGIVCLQAENL